MITTPFFNPNDPSSQFQSETTGRVLVSLDKGISTERRAINRLRKADLNIASTSDYDMDNFSLAEALSGSDGVFFHRLGVGILNSYPNQDQISVITSSNNGGLIIEPERVVYAIGDLSAEYMRGYYDAVKSLYEKSVEGNKSSEASSLLTSESTWGLQLTNVINSTYTGKGIKIAVLDTGFHTEHPDFVRRKISYESFVKGETANDFNGHGTHCIGTALGPKTSSLGVRYGIAHEAEIFVGKVLSNAGRGVDGDILDGLEWAVANGCKIISMSLGARVDPNRANNFSSAFEQAARNALDQGTLIVAAAGNDSQRDNGIMYPVSHPANCPSIMAVAAVDNNMRVGNFSNRGQIDLAGPGVSVYSAWTSPELIKTISGTSMATPHVAGIAALWSEANPDATAYQLWQFLTQNARRLNGSASDVGAGLVQAPL